MRRVFKAAASAWLDHNAPRLGAAIAYYSVLSVAPALVIALAITGAAFGKRASDGEIFWQIQDVVGPQIAAVIESILRSASHAKASVLASILGFAVMLVGASGVFVELRDTLNYIWNAPTVTQKFSTIIRERFLSFAMVIGAGFLLTASVAVTAVVEAAGSFLGVNILASSGVVAIANAVASLAITAILFALIYRIIPEVHVDWTDAAVGAILTAVLFSAGRLLIGVYIGKAGVGSAYGAAGSVVILLVWVYYSAQIFLFGAEFTHAYAGRRKTREGAAHPSQPGFLAVESK